MKSFICTAANRHSFQARHSCELNDEIVEPVIYVRAPLNPNATVSSISFNRGTRQNPYASLLETQNDTTWNTLIVLYSPVPLDGGITLIGQQKIIGDPSGLQPMITNTDIGNNTPGAIILTGDNVVKNLHLLNTLGAGINYDLARDVLITDVLITGFNQGEILTDYQIPFVGAKFLEVAAIEGHADQDGTAIIRNVIIRDNFTGDAIHDLAYNGSKRKLILQNVEVSNLTSTKRLDQISTVLVALSGIISGALDYRSSAESTIHNLYVHDFIPSGLGARETIALGPLAVNGGQVTMTVTNSRFENLNPNNGIVVSSVGIGPFSYTDIKQIPSQGNNNYNNFTEKSLISLTVSNTLFEEPVANESIQTGAILSTTENGDVEWTVENSIAKQIFDVFAALFVGDSNQQVVIRNNQAYGFEAFFVAYTDRTSLSLVSNPQKILRAIIEYNNYKGGDALGAIVILDNVSGGNDPFTDVKVKATGNCFDGQGTGFAGIAVENFGQPITVQTTVKVSAHYNNFVGYNFDVFNTGVGATVNAQRNYWGPGDACVNALPIGSSSSSSRSKSSSLMMLEQSTCGANQICHRGQCLGPANVRNAGNGTVDVTNPLDRPIHCAPPLQQDFTIQQ